MLHCYWDYCWIFRKTMWMWIEEEVATKVVVTEANPRNYRSKWINNMFECWNCGKTHTWKKTAKIKSRVRRMKLLQILLHVKHGMHLLWQLKKHSWYMGVGFGCVVHITCQHDILENYVVGDHGKVYLSDGEPLDFIGIDDVNLKIDK